jgi:cephalosporin hydroxylase
MNQGKPASPSRKHVRVRPDKNVDELNEAGHRWIKALSENRLNYEIDWLGMPVIQTPEDLVLMQELIYSIRPDIIVEIGIAHGGGLVFYASLLELLGRGHVIGVDIEIRPHNRTAIENHWLSHRIDLIEGDSTSDETFGKVKTVVPRGSRVIVCLDSDHTRTHVLKELALYQSLIPVGGYFVVFDTVISRLAAVGNSEEKYLNNSPMEAVLDFIKLTPDFRIDTNYNKLYVSSAPDGFLQRVSIT